MIETDEGSHYLGEIALVPYHSPISDTNVTFYNTLFDENAACHLAIGFAFPFCLEGGLQLSKEEQLARGLNQSLAHVDFMIGTADLAIDGVREDGSRSRYSETETGHFNAAGALRRRANGGTGKPFF